MLNLFLFYFFFTLFSIVSLKILSDIIKVNTHLKTKPKTLPLLLGRKRAAKIVFIFSVFLFYYTIVIINGLKENTIYFYFCIFFITLPLLYFMIKLWVANKEKDFIKLRYFIKFVLFFGMLSVIFLVIN